MVMKSEQINKLPHPPVAKRGLPFRIAFILFNGLTALDFVGVYDSIVRLKTMGFIPELEWDICALTDEVYDHTQLFLKPTRVGGTLEGYDIVIVPGGFSASKLVDNIEFVNWLKTARSCKIKASVCSGSLLLGAAGFLEGKKATSHLSAFDKLAQYCAQVIDQKVVEDGDVITARGVTSSIDLGLYLCETLAGTDAKEKIRKQIDFGE